MQGLPPGEIPEPLISADEIEAFFDRDFPQVHQDGRVFTIRSIERGKTVFRLDPNEKHLRPGGTVSGPALFALADVGAYVCILAHIGIVEHTVTTNMNINFMRKAAPGPIDCTSTLMKLGKRLAVVDNTMRDQDGNIVAHATGTYAIPVIR
ncbi:MAG: PaaI family thioesterase [Pseudomonadota bacterium]